MDDRTEAGMGRSEGMEGCVFCKMVAGEIPATRIYEDEAVLAFLDIGPISDGHTLVIPKQHCTKVHECPPEVLSAVAARLGKIAKAVVTAMKADGYNVLANNGGAAGQVVEHLHFHIIPRKTGDKVLKGWPSYKYETGRIEEIAARIRGGLS
jgi:histidine triad (HIT) family protein